VAYQAYLKAQYPSHLGHWISFQPDILDDWGWQAELVGRSLPAYTSTPSTESSLPVLVHDCRLVTKPMCRGWSLIFGSGFELKCFQLLSIMAQLPGSALSDNRYTVGHDAPFLSY